MKFNLIKVRSFIGKRTLMAIMRTFIFLLCTSVFSFSTETSFSQAQVIIDSDKIVSVDEVFNIIQSQTKFRFLYPQDLFLNSPKVKLKKGIIKVSKLLQNSLSGNDVNFELTDNNTIIIKEKRTKPVAIVKTKVVQIKKVSGTITDISGMPLPGISVLQKGTTNGVASDFDGNYTISLKEGSTVLVFSSLGYKTLEKSVGNSTTVNVILEESSQGLDEIVIVGYGTTKKVNLTGAVGVVSGEVLEKRALATVGQGLQGVLPGLNVTVQSGDPSDNVEFNIRGIESINGGSPLILVDNVPMNINQINPNDIASISVLKDASAAAIYGARAAFGVILVTTKKGKIGKTIVTLSTEQTVTSPIFLIDPVTDPFEFMTSQNSLANLNGGTDVYNSDRLADALAYSQNPTEANAWTVRNDILYYNGFNNYQDKVITNSSFQRKYDFSVSGASEKASYYASFGYLSKQGYVSSDESNIQFDRFNALLKADFDVNEWLSLNSKIIYTNTNNNEPHTYAFDASINSVNRLTPIEPLAFPDLPSYRTTGDRGDFERFIGKGFANQNTIPYLEEGSRDNDTKHDIWFTQGIVIKPFEGFVLKSDFSYNAYFQAVEQIASKIDVIEGSDFTEGIDLTNLSLGNGFSGDDYVLNRTQYNQYFTFNLFGEYTYDKLEDHYFKVVAGFNQEELKRRRLQGRSSGLITPGITDLNATSGIQVVEGGSLHNAIRGAFFRFNYSYKEKYLLEVSGRYDGTSSFPTNDRFGFFPSFSLGWRVSKESFMESTSGWLSDLKLRASYGELGNQIFNGLDGQRDYYAYISSLDAGTAEYTNGNGALPIVLAPNLVSPTLTWESVNSTNFGLDASFLKGRLGLSADVYSRETKDMLLRVNKPDILGVAPPPENGATLKTTGWELALNWRDRVGENIKYSIGVNLWDNQTKITKYEGVNPSINSFYEGKNLGEIWGFETIGLFESDAAATAAPSQSQVNGALWEAGDVQYADLNEDGIIDRGTQTLNTETGEFDTGDLRVIGNTTARYSFGLTPNIEYKNFSLNMFFQGVLKRDYYPDQSPHAGFWPYNGTLVTKDFVANSWSPTNTDAYFARPRGTGTKNIQSQTRFLQNGAYLRLKNVTLNYNLEQDLVSKLGMKNASIYLTGQNLSTFTNMRNTLDPEQTFNDNLRHRYYFERSFSLGLRASF